MSSHKLSKSIIEGNNEMSILEECPWPIVYKYYRIVATVSL